MDRRGASGAEVAHHEEAPALAPTLVQRDSTSRKAQCTDSPRKAGFSLRIGCGNVTFRPNRSTINCAAVPQRADYYLIPSAFLRGIAVVARLPSRKEPS